LQLAQELPLAALHRHAVDQRQLRRHRLMRCHIVVTRRFQIGVIVPARRSGTDAEQADQDPEQ